MTNRLDNMPKVFRRINCIDCQEEFQATGPAAKRCAACAYQHKLAYERARDMASRARRPCCEDCSVVFPPNVHAAVKRCPQCAEKKRAEQVKEWTRKAPKERINAYVRKHYEANRDEILERRKVEKFRKENAARQKNRRDRSPGYRLHCNISRVVALSLNGDKGGRKWEVLLGYTRAQLIVHLERQFTKGMTWGNIGGRTGWQVDHIHPRAMFTFSSPDDPGFKACWALTNLRPLWRKENASKRETRLHLI